MSQATITIRTATAADAALLDEIESQSAIVEGGTEVFVLRGEDYLAQRRLMIAPATEATPQGPRPAIGEASTQYEMPTVLIASVDGELAGTYGAVVHRAVIEGRERRLLYIHHARILPQFQRQGVGRACRDRLDEIHQPHHVDSTYWYTARENVAVRAREGDDDTRWSVGVIWGEIATEAFAAAPPLETLGRPARPADGPRIAAMLNAGHSGEQMYRPSTPERLGERLARDPSLYGWERLVVGEGAVVGVWPDWVALRLRPANEAERRQRVGAVLDYGCLPGHEAELGALLRGWARRLHESGIDRLSVFTSAPSRLAGVVRPLLDSATATDFWMPRIAEPAASRYGLYVDHIYY